MGTFGGGGPLDPAGTDFAIKFVRATWKYHGITAERLADDLAGLPAKLDHVDDLAGCGVIGGEQPNAADLQIGATLRVLLTVGDVAAVMENRPGAELPAAGSPSTPAAYQLGRSPPAGSGQPVLRGLSSPGQSQPGTPNSKLRSLGSRVEATGNPSLRATL